MALSLPRSLFILGFALVFLNSGHSEALEVKEARWGFADGVKIGHFNPVFALVYNDSKTENFDGQMIIRPGHFGPTRGVVETKQVFLAPQTSRWVKFAPLVDSLAQDWKIQWGSGPKDWFPMPNLVTAEKCWIFPCAKINQIAQIEGFRSCLDSFWPSDVALTHGVDSVFLDHEPDWTADQEKAFLDWLYLGGKVHILKGNDSLHPKFFRKLKILNGKEAMKRWGSGFIVRHSLHGFQLTVKAIKNSHAKGLIPDYVNSDNREYVNKYLLNSLASARPKPQHRWTLIFSLCVLYLVLIGPVNYLISRKTKGYKPGLAFLLVNLVIFTVSFYFLGRRGYKESTLHYKIEFAQSLGDGSFDIQSWNHLFVVDSGEYLLKQNSSAGFYGAQADAESRLGFVENGQPGQFNTKIPLFSSRSYLARHRASLNGPLLGPVLERVVKPKLQFEIEKGPAYPAEATAWVLYENKVYALRDVGDRLVCIGLEHDDIHPFFNGSSYYFSRFDFNDRTEDEIWTNMKKEAQIALHEFALDISDPYGEGRARMHDIHVVIRAESPAEWSIIDWPTPHHSITFFQFVFPNE